MRFVVDANILFAALIKDGTTRRILLFSEHEFFSPDFSIEEFKKHLPELSEKTGLEAAEINVLFEKIAKSAALKIVPFEKFFDAKSQAEKISPDAGDAAYFALALHLNCAIWSNDKEMKNQDAIKIFSTKELMQM
ncbi:MAG: PIN domain-containing protein [Candidatus ainarchaeum sp.]|nr:PIN domain-containing protein [Candidatus ainarchaeum sp.]